MCKMNKYCVHTKIRLYEVQNVLLLANISVHLKYEFNASRPLVSIQVSKCPWNFTNINV